jgi:hypothetical protein
MGGESTKYGSELDGGSTQIPGFRLSSGNAEMGNTANDNK